MALRILSFDDPAFCDICGMEISKHFMKIIPVKNYRLNKNGKAYCNACADVHWREVNKVGKKK